jgi:hypothetical protein
MEGVPSFRGCSFGLCPKARIAWSTVSGSEAVIGPVCAAARLGRRARRRAGRISMDGSRGRGGAAMLADAAPLPTAGLTAAHQLMSSRKLSTAVVQTSTADWK